jgi:hypothetical protein
MPSSPDSAPLVSVVIPAFNAARTIMEAVASVQAQTWSRIELIVVDDASTDRTTSLLQAEATAGKLQLLRQGSNQGVAAARNRGIQAARVQLIAFLDADDLWHPDHLARAAAVLQQHPDIDVFMQNSAVIGLDDDSHRGHWLAKRRKGLDRLQCTDLGQGVRRIDGHFIEGVMTACFVHVQTLVARRTVFSRVQFNERLRWSEDLDWAIRSVHEGRFTWAWSEAVTGIYRRHPDSLSHLTPDKQERVEQTGLSLFGSYLHWPGLDKATRQAIHQTLLNSCMDLLYFARQKGQLNQAWRYWVLSLRHGRTMRQAKECAKLAVMSLRKPWASLLKASRPDAAPTSAPTTQHTQL